MGERGRKSQQDEDKMKCQRSGKVVYRTYEQAQYQARWRKRHKNQRTGQIYKCKYCGGWHSTSEREVNNRCRGKRKSEPYHRQKIKRGESSHDLYD